MKKNMIKISALIIAFLLIAALTMSVVNGMSSKESLDSNQYNDATDDSGAAELMQSWMSSALVIVQVVGVGVAVIMLVVLAIKYISAAPSDKAEIKKHAVVYVVGAIVLFAASGILGIIRKFADQANELGN